MNRPVYVAETVTYHSLNEEFGNELRQKNREIEFKIYEINHLKHELNLVNEKLGNDNKVNNEEIVRYKQLVENLQSFINGFDEQKRKMREKHENDMKNNRDRNEYEMKISKDRMESNQRKRVKEIESKHSIEIKKLKDEYESKIMKMNKSNANTVSISVQTENCSLDMNEKHNNAMKTLINQKDSEIRNLTDLTEKTKNLLIDSENKYKALELKYNNNKRNFDDLVTENTRKSKNREITIEKIAEKYMNEIQGLKNQIINSESIKIESIIKTSENNQKILENKLKESEQKVRKLLNEKNIVTDYSANLEIEVKSKLNEIKVMERNSYKNVELVEEYKKINNELINDIKKYDENINLKDNKIIVLSKERKELKSIIAIHELKDTIFTYERKEIERLNYGLNRINRELNDKYSYEDIKRLSEEYNTHESDPKHMKIKNLFKNNFILKTDFEKRYKNVMIDGLKASYDSLLENYEIQLKKCEDYEKLKYNLSENQNNINFLIKDNKEKDNKIKELEETILENQKKLNIWKNKTKEARQERLATQVSHHGSQQNSETTSERYQHLLKDISETQFNDMKSDIINLINNHSRKQQINNKRKIDEIKSDHMINEVMVAENFRKVMKINNDNKCVRGEPTREAN